MALGLCAGIAKGRQEGMDANRTSVFRAHPTKLGLEEEELLAQLASNLGASKGRENTMIVRRKIFSLR